MVFRPFIHHRFSFRRLLTLLALALLVITAAACSLTAGAPTETVPTLAVLPSAVPALDATAVVTAEATVEAVPATATTEAIPTQVPTDVPTDVPTEVPTDLPTDVPTNVVALSTGEPVTAVVGLSTRVPATAESTNQSAQVFYGEPIPGPACSISPTAGRGVNIRSEATGDSALLGGLLRGYWLLATELDKTGVWFRISAPNTPVDGGWINSNGMAIRGVCNCTPGAMCERGRPIPTAVPETATP